MRTPLLFIVASVVAQAPPPSFMLVGHTGTPRVPSFLEGEYTPAGWTASGAPYYVHGSNYMYWDPEPCTNGVARWIIDDTQPSATATSNLDGDPTCNYWARIDSAYVSSPPLGFNVWRVSIAGTWTDVTVTLVLLVPPPPPRPPMPPLPPPDPPMPPPPPLLPPPSPPPPPPLPPDLGSCYLVISSARCSPSAAEPCTFDVTSSSVTGTSFCRNTYYEHNFGGNIGIDADLSLGPAATETSTGAGAESTIGGGTDTCTETEDSSESATTRTLQPGGVECQYTVVELNRYNAAVQGTLSMYVSWCSDEYITHASMSTGTTTRTCPLAPEHLDIPPCRPDMTAECCGTPCHNSPQSCFPNDATVIRDNGLEARVDALSHGDRILAASADGALMYDTVSRWSLARTNVSSAFVRLISTGLGGTKSLELTASHNLPVGPAKQLKQAGDIMAGDIIWVTHADLTALVAHQVVSADVVIREGLHNPLLRRGGMPVINGVATSFNTNAIVAIDAISIPIIEAICAATGTCETARKIITNVECATKRIFKTRPTCKTFHYIDGAVIASASAVDLAYVVGALTLTLVAAGSTATLVARKK